MLEKQIIMSLKPRWALEIFQGNKTVELRRSFAKNLAGGTRCYVYVSSPEKMVAGYVTIKDVIVSTPDCIWKQYGENTSVSRKDFDNYFSDKSQGTAIILDSAVQYTMPLTLKSLREKCGFVPPVSWRAIKNAEIDFLEERT